MQRRRWRLVRGRAAGEEDDPGDVELLSHGAGDDEVPVVDGIEAAAEEGDTHGNDEWRMTNDE